MHGIHQVVSNLLVKGLLGEPVKRIDRMHVLFGSIRNSEFQNLLALKKSVSQGSLRLEIF